MEHDTIELNGLSIPLISLNTAVVGSGCAGYNAAVKLFDAGQKDIAIFTEGINMGTSRNTGSDKQTYYKLSVEGNDPDSVYDMAKTYYDGGSMHGDIALVEAAASPKAFFDLVGMGVPFPHNKYGEYIGYKTDHDPKKRATSAGPLTSRYMTEKLEAQVLKRNIKIFDRFLVIKILTDINGDEKAAYGMLALDLNKRCALVCISCTNIVFATGGPAGIYESSVYPESQNGSMGIAFLAGCRGINLTESQYGIASKKFRWNLSGTYQQVLPRYVSTDKDGKDESEFLIEYFSSYGKMLDAVFLKGYQWPFDPRKIKNEGSSLIDLLVYNEIHLKKRRVFLDYMKNPLTMTNKKDLDFDLLGEEAYEYLQKSDALSGIPIDRLKIMNLPAIDLYMENGIDLSKEYLEIDVCAQHNNGGLLGNIWYESNVKHLFPVGEANGVFGVYRPGGSALNSTQISSLRAALFIAANYTDAPCEKDKIMDRSRQQIQDTIDMIKVLLDNTKNGTAIDTIDSRIKSRMTRYGAHIRNKRNVDRAIDECKNELEGFKNARVGNAHELDLAFRVYNNLITEFVYMNAISAYFDAKGVSRGSYILAEDDFFEKGFDDLKRLHFFDGEDMLSEKICETEFLFCGVAPKTKSEWRDVRSLPKTDNWFENVWRDFREGKIFKD